MEYQYCLGDNIGHATLINQTGSDIDVVNAARVSFGKRIDSISPADIKLIEYLIKHNHGTPLEHNSLTFLVKCPLFVARQWCLSGDTEVYFVNGRSNEWRRKVNMKTLHDRFQRGGRVKQQICRRKMLKWDTHKNEIGITYLKNIWISGKRKVYKIVCDNAGTQDYFSIIVTDDHPLLSENGWVQLKDFIKVDNNNNCLITTPLRIRCIGKFLKKQKQKVKFEKNSINENIENWIDIYDYEGIYEISDQGRIRKKENKKLITIFEKNDNGYFRLYVGLNKNKIYKQHIVSRLMLASFVGKENLQVQHIDGNALNNNLNNLKYGTAQQNINDSINHGTARYPTRDSEFREVIKVEYCGEEDVYDLEVCDEDHNFVAGGLVVHNCRHRIGISINEISARYVEVKDEFYIPLEFRAQSKSNRQASIQSEDLDQTKLNKMYSNSISISFDIYKNLIDAGVAREQARAVLPLASYTEFYWTCNLRSLLHFVSLRNHDGAQFEIQKYAESMLEQTKKYFPHTISIYQSI